MTLPRRTIHVSRIACAHPHVGTTECRVPVRMRLFDIVCSLGGASSTWLISHVSCLFACTFSATGPINAYYTAWTGCEQPIARSPHSHVGWTHAAAAVLRTYIAACAHAPVHARRRVRWDRQPHLPGLVGTGMHDASLLVLGSHTMQRSTRRTNVQRDEWRTACNVQRTPLRQACWTRACWCSAHRCSSRTMSCSTGRRSRSPKPAHAHVAWRMLHVAWRIAHVVYCCCRL